MKQSTVVIVFLLGLFFKVADAENSTQMYFLEFEFEKSVKSNVMGFLKLLTQIDNTNAVLSEFNSTTECSYKTDKNCSCLGGYTWISGTAPQCISDGMCLLNVNVSAICVSDKTVSIKATSTISDEPCGILCNPSYKNTLEYQNKTQNYTKMLSEKFSTLKYFESLVITGFRSGSILADYTVQLLGPVSASALSKVAMNLNDTKLNTTGFVTITAPVNQPIDINSAAKITCTPQLNQPGLLVRWLIINYQNKTSDITNGQEATLKGNVTTDIIELNNISGSWKGTFKCIYKMGSIQHMASKDLDIALLPEIMASSDPQFPDCRDKTIKSVTIVCAIVNNSENYTVDWTLGADVYMAGITNETNGDVIIYKAQVEIKCTGPHATLNATCMFTNPRAKILKTKAAKVEMPIIYNSDEICIADNSWKIGKIGFTAIKSCSDGVGFIKRECRKSGWEKEISTCVIKNLHEIQKEVEEIQKGQGYMKTNAHQLFDRIKDSTNMDAFNSFANINITVNILHDMNNISVKQSNRWMENIIPNFVGSASNLLNDTKAWINPTDDSTDVSIKYLQTIENIISNANLTSNYSYNYENAKMQLCESTNMTGHCKSFNASADTTEKFVLFGFKNLHEILPKAIGNYSNTTILSVSIIDKTNVTGTSVKLWFESAKLRPPNHMMYCVYWDLDKKMWSSKDCIWGGADEPTLCTCTHNSAFTIMISKTSETLPYMEELTYAGLGTSIVSLLLCLIIEILVWDSVVKTPISNFRHVAQVNISFCLLLAHSAFLLTSKPEQIDQIWCSALTFIKHFFFLAVFFWMLCLSFVLLHQMIYIFDHLRKKVLIGLSITVGYAFPVIAVVVTILTFDGGAQDEYFSPKTCWLIYKGPLKGSIFAFVIPVGAIVFVNMFTLAVVIMKIATPAVSEAKVRDEKDVVRRMIKTIILLSPVLGITWLLGFFVLTIDLTTKPLAQIINYSFTILNSLQGFFILLTNYIGEKRVRDALLKRFKSKQSVQSKNEHLSKSSSSEKKK